MISTQTEIGCKVHPFILFAHRFPHGSRSLTSDSGVKGEALGKPDKRRLISSANDPIHTTKDIMISMDKHFDITQGMHNEKNKAAIKEFIAHYGNVRPGNIDMYGDEDVCKRTMEVTDGKLYHIC